MSFPPSLDPNLEEVLRDVANDPDSKLFPGVHLDRLQSSFRAPVDTITHAGAGFSSAEKELLFMHRRALGQVLEDAFVVGYLADKERAKWVRPIGKVVSLADVQNSAVVARDLAPALAFRHGTTRQISLLLDGLVPTSPGELRQLAATALRVGGTPKARYYYALSCEHYGDFESGLTESRNVSATSDPNVALRGMALMRRVQIRQNCWKEADKTSLLTLERCALYGEKEVFGIEIAHQVVQRLLRRDRKALEEIAGLAKAHGESLVNIVGRSAGKLSRVLPGREWTEEGIRFILERPGDLS